jgi:hypothetical protein
MYIDLCIKRECVRESVFVGECGGGRVRESV